MYTKVTTKHPDEKEKYHLTVDLFNLTFHFEIKKKKTRIINTRNKLVVPRGEGCGRMGEMGKGD